MKGKSFRELAGPVSAYFAELFPEHLRVGPWHIVAKIYFAVLLGAIAYARKHLWELSGPPVDAEPLVSPATLLAVRLVGLLWSGGFLIAMQRKTGCWPMVGFTVQSWTWMTMRYALGVAAMLGPTTTASLAVRLSEGLRFVSLLQNSLTVLVWWFVLVPGIYFSTKTKADRAHFMRSQWTPFLINVHLLNLPLAAVEHLVNPRLLVPRDIWTSIAFSMAYFVVYMCVLDANGLHFYIILSPRTPLFVLSFSALMGAHLAVYWGWNALTAGLASGLELVPS